MSNLLALQDLMALYCLSVLHTYGYLQQIAVLFTVILKFVKGDVN